MAKSKKRIKNQNEDFLIKFLENELDDQSLDEHYGTDVEIFRPFVEELIQYLNKNGYKIVKK